MGAPAAQISWDDRPVMAKLRRRQLLDFCRKRGIALPSENIAKDDILKALEVHGVNLNEPAPEIDWHQRSGLDERGRPNVDIIPVVPEHESARMGIDYNAAINAQIAKTQEAEATVEDQKGMIESLMNRVNQLEANTVPIANATPAQLKGVAKRRGIDVTGLSTKKELLQALSTPVEG